MAEVPSGPVPRRSVRFGRSCVPMTISPPAKYRSFMLKVRCGWDRLEVATDNRDGTASTIKELFGGP